MSARAADEWPQEPYVELDVTGRPRPQGSKTSRAGRVLDANPQSRRWRDIVVAEARAQMANQGLQRIVGPVRVEATFRFLRPTTAVGLRAAWPFTTATPDLDKLTRAVLDGLQQAGVIRNDCQVVELASKKRHVLDHEEEGVSVAVLLGAVQPPGGSSTRRLSTTGL